MVALEKCFWVFYQTGVITSSVSTDSCHPSYAVMIVTSLSLRRSTDEYLFFCFIRVCHQVHRCSEQMWDLSVYILGQSHSALLNQHFLMKSRCWQDASTGRVTSRSVVIFTHLNYSDEVRVSSLIHTYGHILQTAGVCAIPKTTTPHLPQKCIMNFLAIVIKCMSAIFYYTNI